MMIKKNKKTKAKNKTKRNNNINKSKINQHVNKNLINKKTKRRIRNLALISNKKILLIKNKNKMMNKI